MRRYFKDLPQNALDKKSNFEYLEREVGMQKFMPQRILETFKPKSLRKSIHQHFKKYTQLDEQSCMFRFLEILKQYYRYVNKAIRSINEIENYKWKNVCCALPLS